MSGDWECDCEAGEGVNGEGEGKVGQVERLLAGLLHITQAASVCISKSKSATGTTTGPTAELC